MSECIPTDKDGNLWPDSIIIDDLDDVTDSIADSVKRLKRLAASVIPGDNSGPNQFPSLSQKYEITRKNRKNYR